jgi:hypothetical protein
VTKLSTHGPLGDISNPNYNTDFKTGLKIGAIPLLDILNCSNKHANGG